MTHQWDDFSKSLAEKSLPRRESLRLLGAALAGAVLSPLGLGTAWGRGPDPCKTFCKCRNKQQQNACFATCRACSGGARRPCGTCGNHFCADMANDVYNCGACGAVCQWLPNTNAGCVDGECFYTCQQGFENCNGDPGDGCETDLRFDPNNCGACGYACGGSTPYCTWGTCTECPPGTMNCGGYCVDVAYDPFNCGACGVVCAAGGECLNGVCYTNDPGDGEPCTPDHPYYPNC